MNKYRNQKVMMDGELFDSKGEADRWAQLKLMARARVIHSVSRQPRFVLCVNAQEVCEYRADFAYWENGRQVIEDFKGIITPVARLKRKLFMALYPSLELRFTNKRGEIKIRTRKASKLKVAA